MTQIQELKPESFFNVLTFLNAKEICTFSSICKSWEKLLREEAAWKAISYSHFALTESEKRNGSAKGWKKFFINRNKLESKWLQAEKPAFSSFNFESHGDSVTCSVITLCHPKNTELAQPKKVLVSCDAAGFIVQWDLLSKLPMKTLPGLHQTSIIQIEDLGSNVLVTCSAGDKLDGENARVVFVDQGSGEAMETVKLDQAESNLESAVTQFTCFDSKLFAFTSGSKIHVWHKATGSQSFKQIHLLSAHDYEITMMKKITGFIGENDSARDGIVGRRCIITGSMDGTMKVWDIMSGSLLGTLKGHQGSVSCVDIAAEGDFIVSGGYDSTVRVWDKFAHGKLVQTLEGHSKAVSAVQISKQGTTIVTGSKDNTIKVWKLSRSQGKFICTATHKLYSVSCLKFDSSKIITGCSNGMLYIHNAKTGQQVFEKSAHLNAVTRVDFDDENKYLITNSVDCGIVVHDYSLMREWDYSSTVNAQGITVVKELVYDPQIQTYMKPPTSTWHIPACTPQPQPICKTLVLPERYKDTCILYNVFSESECQHFISESEKVGYEDCFGYHPNYRSNKRIIVADQETANLIFERIKPHVPKTVEFDGSTWSLIDPEGLNDRLRLCRYTPGQHFSPHIDGFLHVDKDTRSFFTFMIYLNDGYQNGTTNFLEQTMNRQEKILTYRVIPKAGMALVFPHELYHEGEVLSSGIKYLLRSDLMYRRNGATASATSKSVNVDIYSRAAGG